MTNFLKQMHQLIAQGGRNTSPQGEDESSSAAGSSGPGLQDAMMGGWFRHETGELVEGFPIKPDDSVLDVGCGRGEFSLFCAQQGANVTFADINEKEIDSAVELFKKEGIERYTPLVTSADPLPLADNFADKVIAMEVIEHVEQPLAFLKELVRVGKPGGLFLITVPDELSEKVQKELAPSAHFEKPNHINVFSREAFENLVRESGLTIEHRTYHGFYWSVWWALFWTCSQDLSPPWHPALQAWSNTWAEMLNTPDGSKIKKALDNAMPKSQAIIARKL